MAMNSTGPISLAGTVSGQSIQLENGGNGSSPISMGDVWVRDLADTTSGAISMSSVYGKSHIFYTTISAAQANLNLRSYAVSSGWNQYKPVVVTVNSGVSVYSNSTASYALTIDGTWNAGVTLVNNGVISGMGGTGGAGASSQGGGAAGGSGGNALSVSSTVKITNNGTIAGGGGGGGGAGSARFAYSSGKSTYYAYSAGGGGGGGAGAAVGPGGGGGYDSQYSGAYAAAGASGASTTGGGGGAGQPNYTTGGAGGNLGAAGAAGQSSNTGGGAGGAAGYYVVGNANVTWLTTGSLLGNVA